MQKDIFTMYVQQAIYLWSDRHGEFGTSANRSFLQALQNLAMELWKFPSQTAGIQLGRLGRMNAKLAITIGSKRQIGN